VLVTTGGGGDGYPLMDAYLRMLEARPEQEFQTVMVTGPFMPKSQRKTWPAGPSGWASSSTISTAAWSSSSPPPTGWSAWAATTPICEILTHKEGLAHRAPR
jgi:hypothetical protein